MRVIMLYEVQGKMREGCHEASGFESASTGSAGLGDFDCGRSAGWDFVVGGEVAGDAFSLASDPARDASALRRG